MNLLNTTFTGVDEKTSLSKLEEISKEYPSVEWGILYTENTSSMFSANRYPTQDWLEKNVDKLNTVRNNTGCQFSLHVCGSNAVTKLLNQEPSFLMDLISSFNRVQINFHYKPSKLELLEALLDKYKTINFITQHNKSNQELYKIIKSANHHLLFDSSGGRGIETNIWEVPLSNKLFGYAGGLGEDNISFQLKEISKVVSSDSCWIDMEGKIRTEDYLDLDKCINVLNEIETTLKEINNKKFTI